MIRSIEDEKICDICKEQATKVCFDCSFYLCDSCLDYIHEKKSNFEHKNEAINQIIPLLIKCEKHPKIPITMFSKDEKSKKINNL